jgi:hypothetical protein
VILGFRSKPGPCRHARVFAFFAMAALVGGCGTSGSPNSADGSASATPPKQLLKDEQLYKYVGEGQAKRKEPISRRERAQLVREAKEKAQ